jgi:signal transduction histidine kinase
VQLPPPLHRFRWYLYAVGMVALATLLTIVALPWLGPAIAVFFFPAVVIAAIYGGYGPGLLTSVLSTVTGVFFVVPPQTEIDIGLDDAIRFVVLCGVSLTVSALSAAREAAQEAERQSLLVIAEQSRELAVRKARVRVSRDLHDGILQGLTGIRLEIHDIAEAAPMPAAAHDRLLATERALAIEQRELRRLIDDLNPKSAVRAGGEETLDGALRRKVERLSLEWKTPITVQVIPSDLSVPAPLEQAIGLMCQEATINALKHAHPSRVSISVSASDAAVRLTVVDDGRGFPFSGRFDHDALVEEDMGPVTLRDRAAAMNGRLAVESGARGSRVEITLPLSAA